MKNILVLIRHYLPGHKMGGPLTSILNIINSLSGQFNFKIITLDRDLGDKQSYDKIVKKTWLKKENYFIYYLPKNILLIFNLIAEVKKTSAETVYINSFFDPLFSIPVVFAKKLGILGNKNLIIAPRGEFFFEALNFKRGKKSVYLSFVKFLGIYKSIIWHASTEYEKKSIIKALNIDPHNVKVAINIPSVEKEPENILPRNELSFLEQSFKIVYLSRISKDKNIPFTFDVLNKITSPVIFDIYGPIEDRYIWDICLEKIKMLPKNIKVNYLGSIDKKDVKNTLKNYDLFFLPTFSENYGHVIVEALSVGTPVLISDKTPWRNLENDGFGWDISLNSPQLFVDAINRALSLSKPERLNNRGQIKLAFNKKIEDPSIVQATIDIFN